MFFRMFHVEQFKCSTCVPRADAKIVVQNANIVVDMHIRLCYNISVLFGGPLVFSRFSGGGAIPEEHLGCTMKKFSSFILEYQARDYFAFCEVVEFCHRRNCDYIEDASRLSIVSKFSGLLYAHVPCQLVSDTRVDPSHVALLRALVDNLHSIGDDLDPVVYDSRVQELLFSSAA